MTSPAAAPNRDAPLAPPPPPGLFRQAKPSHRGAGWGGDTHTEGDTGRPRPQPAAGTARQGRARRRHPHTHPQPRGGGGRGGARGEGARPRGRWCGYLCGGRLLSALGRRCRLVRCRRLSESGRLPAPRFYTQGAAAPPTRPRTSPYMEIFQKHAFSLAGSRTATWGGGRAAPAPRHPGTCMGQGVCGGGRGGGAALRRRPPAPVGPRWQQHRGTPPTPRRHTQPPAAQHRAPPPRAAPVGPSPPAHRRGPRRASPRTPKVAPRPSTPNTRTPRQHRVRASPPRAPGKNKDNLETRLWQHVRSPR